MFPGSGKTTTALYVCKEYHDKKILLLTYNANLRHETKQKLTKLKLTNCMVHTYHSFNRQFFGSDDYTDIGINDTLKKDKNNCSPLDFDIFILDEVQDMTFLYYEFVLKIMSLNLIKNYKILVLGDSHQCIYKYNDAHEQFLILANQLYITDHGWESCKLQISYRLTKQIADFINKVIIKQDRIKTIKDGVLPRYIVCDSFASDTKTNAIFNEIKRLLSKGYKYGDIFVLAPSIKRTTKNDSPCRSLANMLTRMNIPIFVPISDDCKIDEKVIKNKILFCTFHQSKGLENRAVIVYGLDAKYFEFFAKNTDPNICPNEFYVAMSRAKEELILIHDYQSDYINFMDVNKLKDYVEYIRYNNVDIIKNMKKRQGVRTYSVIELIRHTPVMLIHNCVNSFKTDEIINDDNSKISLQNTTSQQFDNVTLNESVSEINGIAVIAYSEQKIFNTLSILNAMCVDNNRMTELHLELNINKYEDEIENLLYLSNMYNAYMSRYIFKTIQITDYDWLSKNELDQTYDRFRKIVSMNTLFEIPVFCEINNIIVYGAIDAIDFDNHVIYEFKCVETLIDEHKLQLIIYSYLLNFTLNYYSMNGLDKLLKCVRALKNHKFIEKMDYLIENKQKFKYVLYNILDNKAYTINIDTDMAKNVVDLLYKYKFENVIEGFNMNKAKKLLSIYNAIFEYNGIINSTKDDDSNVMHEFYTILNNHNKILTKKKLAKRYILFDTETTYTKHLTQLSYIIINDKNEKISEHDHIVNPEGKYSVVTPKSTFNDDDAKKYGKKVGYILDEFHKELISAELLISHNIKFDVDIMIREYTKINNHDAIKLLENIKKYDTMIISKNLVNAKNKNGHLKVPSLNELYQFICKKPMDDEKAHNAMYDVKCLLKCYKGLMKIDDDRERVLSAFTIRLSE